MDEFLNARSKMPIVMGAGPFFFFLLNCDGGAALLGVSFGATLIYLGRLQTAATLQSSRGARE